ncbi:DegT/DnrJ/EryC1/StrS family aminotransferase [Ilumatobacter sp.]|uniref:DegT/DnrJ/EryC1/StrS family aminotransferase n=1 Tax=Ilumatobacter sp. TaxID=1967498 RepID=UPI0037524763
MNTLAINGGPPVRTTPYKTWPHHDDAERKLLSEVLESDRWWSSQGTKVHEFERRWGEFHGTDRAVAVTNGSHAIDVALLALGIGAGDEVIVPAWTFFATAAAVLMVNAIPVLVDVDPATGCIDPTAAEAAITDRTAAIIAVHIAGHPADMDRLTALCQQRGIALVEDCAHAHGSRWNGQIVGTFGDAGTYSFQASKLMTGGEGGAIVSKRTDVLERARSYGDCGRQPGEWFYAHFALGGNYRMSEWQGAVLLAQLDRFEDQARTRDANSELLNEQLARIPGVHPQARDPRCDRQGNYCYVVRIEADEFGADRESVRLALGAEGIPLTMSYPPIHRLDVFREPHGFAPRWRSRDGMQDFAQLSLPTTERLADTTLWFTTAVLMGTREDALDVVAAVEKVQSHADELRSNR